MPANEVSLLGEGMEVTEDGGFLRVAEILPRPRKWWTDFNTPTGDELELVPSTIDEVAIMALKARWGITNHIEMVPAMGTDIVHLHRLRYCPFYEYPFVVGYMLPLPPSCRLLPLL